MNKVISFFSEVKTELAKVTWPKRQDVIKLTGIVFLVSAIFGAFAGGLDYIFTKALELLVSK